jgi:hypothetical protein
MGDTIFTIAYHRAGPLTPFSLTLKFKKYYVYNERLWQSFIVGRGNKTGNLIVFINI